MIRSQNVRYGLLCLVVASSFGGTCFAAEFSFAPLANFLTLQESHKLGRCSAVAVNSQGEIYVFHRGAKPVICVDATGKLLRAWGDGLIDTAHGLRVDRDDNVWVTDMRGHRVLKFDRSGKLLLTLGTGQPGKGPDEFNQPTDIAFAADGSFFVTDGYGNSRVVKFSRDGRFVKTFGTRGKRLGELHLPHSIVIDSRGRLLVGDRENNRIQLFTADGEPLEEWPGFAPYGLAFDPAGHLFVADGRANQVLRLDAQGKVQQRLGAKGVAAGQFELPHMLAFDAAGNLFVAEVGGARLQKFTRLPK